MTCTLTAPVAPAAAGRRGPRTAAGRLASSRNSTRHGYSGAGKSLPEDMRVEVLAQRDRLIEKFRPESVTEHDLVYQLALASVRITRLGTADEAETHHRVRHALRRWDDARAEEVRGLADLLETDPAEATRLLRRTADGTDFLGDEWDALREILQQQGHWDEAQAGRALRLLGFEPDRESPALAEFWLDIDQARAGDDEGLTRLVELVDQEYNELVALGKQLWDEFDRPDRDSAPERALIDTSPEGQKRARYLADAHRLYHRALTELERQRLQTEHERRYAPPPPPRPVPAPAPSPTKTTATPQPPQVPQATQPSVSQPTPAKPTATPTPAPARPRNESLVAMLDGLLNRAESARVDLAITPKRPQTVR